jgi:hypothetical protein
MSNINVDQFEGMEQLEIWTTDMTFDISIVTEDDGNTYVNINDHVSKTRRRYTLGVLGHEKL